MLEANFTNQFVKDAKLLQKRHKDLDDLFDILVKMPMNQMPNPGH
jgi:mRNA-degrading endonuclease YafQ of YafQ-DinJ toxin-antitoxin module